MWIKRSSIILCLSLCVQVSMLEMGGMSAYAENRMVYSLIMHFYHFFILGKIFSGGCAASCPHGYGPGLQERIRKIMLLTENIPFKVERYVPNRLK